MQLKSDKNNIYKTKLWTKTTIYNESNLPLSKENEL